MRGELEQQLLALAEGIEFPPEPDVVEEVLGRLPRRRVWHARPARRTLAIAVAVTLLLAGAALAVPSTRDAILRVVGLRGVVIERVPQLPPRPAGKGRGLDLGSRIPIASARHAARFTALLPAHPTAAYLGHDVPGGRISVRVGPALVIEFRAAATPFVFKLIGPHTHVKLLRVNGGHGAWLSGAPHAVLIRVPGGEVRADRIRLEGDVLLWQQGPLTIRIEGEPSVREALALARTLR